MDQALLLERISQAKKLLKNKGIDVAYITKDENKFYFTNFSSSNFYVILTETENYLLTDFRYIELASGLEPIFCVKILTGAYSIFDFIKEKISGTQFGIEESMTNIGEYRKLKEIFREDQIIDIEAEINSLRVIKDAYEKSCIMEAARIGDQAFTHILNFIKPGLTEIEIALELEFYMRKNGAEATSFDTICASGERSSMPHAVPSQRKIKNGDFITLDFGCKVNGYCSDMTRTVALGSVTQEQKDVYDLVYKAQTACVKQLRAGMKCKDLDKIARDIFAEKGYKEEFGHGLGHGVGLEIHEAPTANSRSEEIFEENMLITIEPGIYLAKKFGIRIEDLAIVEKYGMMNLSKSDKHLIIL